MPTNDMEAPLTKSLVNLQNKKNIIKLQINIFMTSIWIIYLVHDAHEDYLWQR